MSRPLHIKGANLWDGKEAIQRDLCIHKGRIVESAPNDALTVDLEGMTIFPGLINAHDHLHQNHFPRTKFREVYNNAHEWGEDVNARLDTEPYKSLRAVPMKDRLFIGGLKNLLCGATTVAHHDTPYKEMFHRDFPVRVLKQYGYAHSLHFETDEAVVRCYQKTPKNWPWFIHLAEGTDDVAAAEYQKLKTMSCVGENTVIVHGVGMTEADIEDAAKTVRGLVWCPSSNQYLLDKTLRIDDYWAIYYGTVAIGSDSRLTAHGDLLEEQGIAATAWRATHLHYEHEDLLNMLTTDAASIIGTLDAGHLNSGAYGDFVLLDSSIPLLHALRGDLLLVVKDGIPRIGDPDIMAKFPYIQTVPVTLDGVPKAIHIDLAKRIHQCSINEPDLEVGELPSGKRFWFF